MGKIKVAIIGVGNCASSFVQGLHKYKEVPEDEFVPGLMHNNLGGYTIGDTEVVAAFDVDRTRSGRTSRRRSSPARTTPSSSPKSPAWASRSIAG